MKIKGKDDLPEDIRVYTPEEVAIILDVDIQTVWKWTREGKLRCKNLSGNRLKRYLHSEIVRFLNNAEEG